MNKYLALDLGGTFLKAAIIDEDINILDKWKTDTSKALSIDDIMNVFDVTIKGHLDGCKAIAISCPGRIDVNRGVMVTAGKFDDFMNGFELAKVLEDKYHLPVSVDNDGKCAANAELWKGALKDTNNGVVYVIGTGIGGGIVINHQVYRGSCFSAGEFSQIIVDMSKKVSGSNAVSEQLSTPALLNQYKKASKSDKDISGEEFFKLVDEKDKVASKVLRKFCKQTVKFFYNLQTCFDFETIAIGGGISAQPILLKLLNKELDKMYLSHSVASVKPKLVRCQFSNDANLIGAVKAMIDKTNK